jgi:hypothetical protein
MPIKRSKPTLKKTKVAIKKKAAPKKKSVRKSAAIEPLDLSALPPESVTHAEKWICLACVLDIFTRHIGLAPKTAHLQIKRHLPSLAELNSSTLTRPYFINQSPDGCPYCGAPPKWHARLRVYRIESGKATDVLRRDLVKSLAKPADHFLVLEEKATRQHAFFEWLEKISTGLDLDSRDWLREVSRHYLSRREPKLEWQAHFDRISSIRRSRRLESGWEIDNSRLFLAPMLFDELLLVQYLVSRSHRSGGVTFEGRYTLGELFARLRNSRYLDSVGVQTRNPSEGLEQLLAHLSGGESSLKFYHIVDRREYLATVKAVGLSRPPKPHIITQ